MNPANLPASDASENVLYANSRPRGRSKRGLMELREMFRVYLRILTQQPLHTAALHWVRQMALRDNLGLLIHNIPREPL